MKIAVLDADTLGSDISLSPLENYGEVRIFPSSSPDEIALHLGDCEVAVINKLKMNRATLGDNRTLRLICLFATGFDNVDLDFCRERGIAVCNVVGYSTLSVAQITVSMALSLVSHLQTYSSHVLSGRYSAGTIANKLTPVYHEIAGMTWGIAGYGNIGKAVGKVAEALGCRVIAFKRTPEDGVETVSLPELCRRSDILSIHLPLSDTTRGIIGKNELALMKDGAILVNMARGAVTDEAAVAEAVKNGHLGGFGCDVYSTEPFTENHPFSSILSCENVCLTPHMAWGAKEARERCLDEICLNIRSFLENGKRSRVDL